jgi:hypothetical protein
MQIPLALVCLLRREIGLFLIFAGLLGGAAAFAGESSASLSESPQKAAFCMLDSGATPLSWESELRLRVDGLEVHDKDMGNWRITLNTVPFKVVHCFVSPGARDPGLHTEVLLVLDGVDCGSADKTPQQVAASMAAAIRRLAPNRWGANRVAVEVSLNGTTLIPVLKTGEPLATAELAFELISWPRRLICVAALAAIAWIFYWAGTGTGALRDSDALNPDFRQRTFSLARCQLAFWTVLVVGSFLYIYMVTGVTSGVLTTTALWLLGISSGTSVLAQAAGNTAANAVPSIPQRSNGFVADILSDSQGVNVHRLQMLIWTAVFGSILVTQVVTRLAFPDYDTTTYALMGISSGTYIWFKRTET